MKILRNIIRFINALFTEEIESSSEEGYDEEQNLED